MRKVVQLSTSKCPPCKLLANKLNEEHPDLEGYEKVDLDLLDRTEKGYDMPSPEAEAAYKLMGELRVTSVPFIAFFENGEIVDKMHGMSLQDRLKARANPDLRPKPVGLKERFERITTFLG